MPYAPAMENIVLTAFKYCPDRSYKNNHVTISDVIPNTDSNVYNPSNCAASSSISKYLLSYQISNKFYIYFVPLLYP